MPLWPSAVMFGREGSDAEIVGDQQQDVVPLRLPRRQMPRNVDGRGGCSAEAIRHCERELILHVIRIGVLQICAVVDRRDASDARANTGKRKIVAVHIAGRVQQVADRDVQSILTRDARVTEIAHDGRMIRDGLRQRIRRHRKISIARIHSGDEIGSARQ